MILRMINFYKYGLSLWYISNKYPEDPKSSALVYLDRPLEDSIYPGMRLE